MRLSDQHSVAYIEKGCGKIYTNGNSRRGHDRLF